MKPYLEPPERAGLLERRRRLVDLIQDRIDRLGESVVLFAVEESATVGPEDGDATEFTGR